MFIYRGSPYIIFSQISDPYGVARLARSSRKSFITVLKSLQKNAMNPAKFVPTIKSQVKQDTPWKPSTQSIRIPDLNWQLENSIVPLYPIRRYQYNITTLDGIDPNKKYNRIVIHPIEAGCCIEFRKEKDANYSGLLLEIKDLRDIQIDQDQKKVLGVFKKKDLVLELSFKQMGKDDYFTIKINIEDKLAQEIMDRIRHLQQISRSNFWSVYNVTHLEEDEKKSSEIFVLAPFLSEDEELLWQNPTFKDEYIVSLQALTNFRILEYDYETGNGKSVLLTGKNLPSVKNIKKGFGKSGNGIFNNDVKLIAELGETKRSVLKEVGDVLFNSEAEGGIELHKVKDPVRIVRLVELANNKLVIVSEDKHSNGISKGHTEREIRCSKCQSANPNNSRYCNNCGSNLVSNCSKCGHDNPMGSEICNNCGSTLR